MKKIVLTFGLLSGLLMSVWMLTVTITLWHSVSMETGMVLGYTSMVAASLFIYFGVRRYRDQVGRVSFWRAFGVGLLIAAVGGACYTATWEAIYAVRGEELMARMQASVVEQARKDGASAAEVERTRAEMAQFIEEYKNPLVNIAYTFLEPLPVGVLAALATAWALSRRRRDGAEAPAGVAHVA